MPSRMDDTLPSDARNADLEVVMAFDPMAGIVDLDRVLTELKDRAHTRGQRFDRHGAGNELQAATFRLRTARTVRLLLSPSGALAIEITPVA